MELLGQRSGPPPPCERVRRKLECVCQRNVPQAKHAFYVYVKAYTLLIWPTCTATPRLLQPPEEKDVTVS